MKKFYWTVRAASNNNSGHIDLAFREFDNAIKEAAKDYRDKPVKQFVSEAQYAELENLGTFMD